MSEPSPFVVPPFDTGRQLPPRRRFTFWGWHPNYPYWSRSCWGGETEGEAWANLEKGGGLTVYALTLVKEEDGGKLTVVDSRPPSAEGLKVWKRIKDLNLSEERKEP